MYPNVGSPHYRGSISHHSKDLKSQRPGLAVCRLTNNNPSLYEYAFRNTTKRMKKLPLSLPLKQQSKYKWENVNNKLTLHENANEKLSPHHQPRMPFSSAILKGWFLKKTCDVMCTKSPSFDLRSCCFIDDKYVPKNTLAANMLSRKTASTVQKKARTLNSDNGNALVRLSKHKLIRQQDGNRSVRETAKKNDSSLVLRTRRKLIRKIETIPTTAREVPSVPEPKPREQIHHVPNEDKGAKECLPNSVVVLTRRKLIREPRLTSSISVELPNKLISVNRNKLINSCLLRNNTALSRSVLYHMIKQRRRPYSRSSYVLLTRNKLIRRAIVKQKLWRRQSIDGSRSAKKPQHSPRMFVSVGKNKLIRKSLFSKRNNKTSEKTSPPFRKAILARVLSSPSKRIQRFTNHLSRRNLKYSYIRGRSRYSNQGKRYLNKCKNNRRTFRKKSDKICPMYRRTGVCLKYSRKNCPFVHDEKYIVLCPKFLKNACQNEQCPLSHSLIPQKMPVCVHFLNGNCTTDGCAFLHTKPDVKAPICVQYLRGYCELADECSNWHVYACPEYKNLSTCARETNCRLPHRSIEYFENNLADEKSVDADGWRYFEKNSLNDSDHRSFPIIPKRQTMGILPDFIPL